MESPALPPPLPESKPVQPLYSYSRLGLVLAVGVIAACAVFVVRMNGVEREEGAGGTRPNRMLELLARYAVGMQGLLQATGQSNEAVTEGMMKDIAMLSRTDEDALRVLILKGWLADAWPAEADLTKLVAKKEALREDVASLGRLNLMKGELEAEAWKKLERRHGWIADLARAQAHGADDATRKVVKEQALGTAMVMIGGMFMGMIAAVTGTVVLILGLVRWRGGRVRLTLERRSGEHGGVLIEGFAIYLLLFIFLPWLLRLLPVQMPRWAAYGPALVALIVGMMWPLWRGMRRSFWRETLGLHRGEGLLKEIGAGVLGWLAALPLLVVGIIAASWIMKFTGKPPTHPIVEVFAGGPWAKAGAMVLAVVWAPISEEVMFRGLLFPGLSAWLRWLLGIVVGAFVFAVIHPQGWAGVPAIMALAAVFSLLRMWRQSLIAPMTAHALNNGVMCAMMVLLF